MKPILKTTVDVAVRDKFEARARERKKSVADMLRQLIEDYVHGRIYGDLHLTKHSPVDSLSDKAAADYFIAQLDQMVKTIDRIPVSIDDIAQRVARGNKDTATNLLRVGSDIRAHQPVIEKLQLLEKTITERLAGVGKALADERAAAEKSQTQTLAQVTSGMNQLSVLVRDQSQASKHFWKGAALGLAGVLAVLALLPANWTLTQKLSAALVGEHSSPIRAAGILLSGNDDEQVRLLQLTSEVLKDRKPRQALRACFEQSLKDPRKPVDCTITIPAMKQTP